MVFGVSFTAPGAPGVPGEREGDEAGVMFVIARVYPGLRGASFHNRDRHQDEFITQPY